MRSAVDKLVSWFGLAIAAVLIVAGALLTWGSTFITGQVHDQLAAQQVYFPPSDSQAVAGPEFAPMRQYGGQQLTTGAQAKVYADNFIAVHLQNIGGGKTYAQLSTEAQANPDDQKLAAQVESVFRGESLRSMLLTAYAFGTIGTIAGIAAIVSFVAAAVMLVLAGLGFWHASRSRSEKGQQPEVIDAPARA